jgi:hypothetical protein
MNNIYNKIYNKNPNSFTHYINNNSSFDLLIEEIFGDEIIRIDDEQQSEYFTIKTIILNNYNTAIGNSAIKNQYYLESNLNNMVVFMHSDIHNFKREDIFLIKNRLQNFNTINLCKNNNLIFNNNMELSLPKTKIKNKGTDKILLIDNLKNIDITKISKNLNIDKLVDFSRYTNYNQLLENLSTYSLVICSHPVDSLVASSVGCGTIFTNNVIMDQKIDKSKIIYNQKINYDFATFSSVLRKLMKL